MASISWNLNGDGDWSNAADWSGGALPGSNDAVTINTLSQHTITHSTGNDFVLSLTVKNDQFDMTGGSLTIGSDASFSNGFNQSGGGLFGTGTVVIAGGATLLGGYAAGGLVLTVKGAIALANYTLGGAASLVNTSTTNQTGQVTIGDNTGVDANLTNQSGGTFNIAGDFSLAAGAASATIVNAGNLAKSAGVGTSFVDVSLASTGTLTAKHGTLEFLAAGDTISGTLAGAGQIAFGGGYAYALAAGTVVSAAGLDLYNSGTSLTLGGDLTYSGALNETVGTLIALGGNTLSLNGTSTLSSGLYGAGLLATAGGTTTVSNLTLAGGANWTNGGAVVETGAVEIGDGLNISTLTNQAGGVYTLASNDGIEPGGNPASSFVNFGTLAKTFAGVSYVDILTSSTGVISAGAGATIDFRAVGDTFAGVLSGAGQIAIVGDGEATLSAKTMTVATFGVYDNGQLSLGRNINYNGIFNVNGAGTAVYFSGYSLKLATLNVVYQDYNNPYFEGVGTLTTTGPSGIDGMTLGGGLVWNNLGVVTQSSHNVQVNDSGTTINNQAGATWNISGDIGIYRNDATTTAFNNAGTLAKVAGEGSSVINVNVNNTGTIGVGGGEIEIAGVANTLGGTILGVGTLGFGGGGETTIAAGASLGSAISVTDNGTTLALGGNESVGGLFSEGYGSSVNLNGYTLTANNGASFYNANYQSPTIGGAGEFVTTGPTSINALVVGGTVTWANSGEVTIVNGPLQIGDAGTSAATLDNAAGGSLLLASDNAQIQRGAVLTNLINNSGLLAKTGGSNTSTVSADVTSTGTVSSASGNLAFNGANNTFGGLITGAGQVSFSGGSTILAAGVTVNVANVDIYNDGTKVTLGRNLTYGGNFTEYNGTTLNLAGHTLTFTGSVGLYYANYGTPTFTGGGVLNTRGATSIGSFVLGGGVTWNNYGAVTLNGTFQVGDATTRSSTTVNMAGAAFLIESDNAAPTIGSGAVVGSTFINDGTLGKVGGNSLYHSRITVAVTNAGLIEAYSGDFQFQGAVSGVGSAMIDDGATLEFDGAVGSGQSIGFGAGGGTLTLTNTANFAGGISNLGANDAIDLAGFGYNATTETINVTASRITVTNGANVANIQLFAQFASGFHLASDGAGGTLILSGPTMTPASSMLNKPHHG